MSIAGHDTPRCPICGCPLDDGTGTEHECPPGFAPAATPPSTLDNSTAVVLAPPDNSNTPGLTTG